MKALRKFVNKNPQIKDDTKVLCQRVDDVYFNKFSFRENEVDGWKVLLVDSNMCYKQPEDEYKDQFFPSFCISKSQEDDFIYIYNHY
jgi:hypothetical protein